MKAQAVAPVFDAVRARAWIEDCEEHHEQSCIEPGLPTAIPGMRLIDCERCQIVSADSSSKWVALSYRWGHQTDEPSSIHDLSRASQTVRDAMKVTRSLGYRYLWVDKYCINQHSASERDDQIQKMDLIYCYAQLVIIAAAGQDERYGLPGVSSTKRADQHAFVRVGDVVVMSTGPDPAEHVMYRSEWWKRAWTFQEGVLPRRRLVFTEHQSFFECQFSSWTEGLGGVECAVDRQAANVFRTNIGSCLRPLLSGYRNPPSLPHEYQRLRDASAWEDAICRRICHFLSLVERYTDRHLTFESDSLKGVTGILKVFEKNSSCPIHHLSGLPYAPLHNSSSDLKFTERYLFVSLCWYHFSYVGSHPNRREAFPSRSWAGWAGAVMWVFSEPRSRRGIQPVMRDIMIESADGSISPADEYLKARDLFSQYPDSALAIHFEAPVVPSAIFETATTPHSWLGHQIRGMPGEPNVSLLSARPTERPDELVQRLDDGSWSCLWLGDYILDIHGNSSFLLVVEWQNAETVTRVGALVIKWPMNKEG